MTTLSVDIPRTSETPAPEPVRLAWGPLVFGAGAVLSMALLILSAREGWDGLRTWAAWSFLVSWGLFLVLALYRGTVEVDEAAPVAVLACVSCGGTEEVSPNGGALVCRRCARVRVSEVA